MGLQPMVTPTYVSMDLGWGVTGHVVWIYDVTQLWGRKKRQDDTPLTGQGRKQDAVC